MSVIVKSIKIPRNCLECNLTNEDDDFGRCCLFTGIPCLNIGRQDKCPLIEIPTPHGRLIDADVIDYRNDAMHDGTGHLVVADNFMNGVLWINDCIDNTPTVIEAEGK